MSKESVLKDPKNRELIRRVLRENFHLYRAKYFRAFFYMALTAAATALSAVMMKEIVAALFGKPTPYVAPTAEKLATAGFFDRIQFQYAEISHKIAEEFIASSSGMGKIVAVSLLIFIIFMVKGFSQYASTVILSRIGNNIVSRQQIEISNHLLRQSLRFYVNYPSSDLIARISQAAASARDVMTLLMSRVQDVFTAVALIITVIKLDWFLALIAFFIMAPIAIGLSAILKRVKKIAKAEYLGIVQVISAIQEGILGAKLIKIYNMERHMQYRFAEAIEGVEIRANKLADVSSRTSPLMESMGGLAIAAIVFYGGYRNLVSGIGAESLIAFLTALLLAYEPIKRIARANVALETCLVGVSMLYEVKDTDLALPEKPNAQAIQLHKGEIQLHNVTFAYRPDEPVLRDISLTCQGGSVTALVGPSGSGKSTILNLLERFYDTDQGHVTIDGQRIDHVTTHSLRHSMSLVSQDTFLFADTIANNIRFARPDATDEEVIAAAKAAYAHDFILEQPQSYQTHIGENGGNLSGGQRQRISIARAFLKNAPILLLDEATSALDSESEQQIQLAFDKLMQGRTTLVIAHRFSTIRNASVIHVMQDGKLVASGSHQQLIEDQQGLYAHLYRLQYQDHPTP